MVPDASVTACEVPDTSLLVIQVIGKRGAVNLADILITKYISLDLHPSHCYVSFKLYPFRKVYH